MSDLDEFRDRYHKSVEAFTQGDPDATKSLWSARGDVTPANPKLGNAAEKVPISLRVTTIFRREDGEWKIVHRHADPITEERPIQSIAQRG